MTLAKVDNLETKKPLPEGWRWARLGDVCKQDKQIIKANENKIKALPYIGLDNVESNTGRIIIDSIGNEIKSSTFVFDERHVLYGKLRPYLNKVALPNFRGRCTTELIPLLVESEISRDYIAWILKRGDTVAVVMSEKTGSRMPRANMDVLFNMVIPLPPAFAEQERIARILNEQMAAVEKARAAAEARLEAAKTLPAAYLREVFGSQESREWQKVSLGNVFRVKSGNFLPANKMNTTGKYPVYGGNGINGYHDTFMFGESKIIIGRVGAQCGCICISEPNAWITDNALYVSEKLKPFDDEFMALLLTKLDLNSKANSMAQPLVSGKIIYDIEISFPEVNKQKQISVNLHKKFSEIEALIERIEAELETIRIIPAALLRRAFTGGL